MAFYFILGQRRDFMVRNKMIAIVVVCVVPLIGCAKDQEPAPPPKETTAPKPPPAAAPSDNGAAPIQGSGTIAGRVVFKGSHTPGKLSVGKDKEVCGSSKPDPMVIIGNDGAVKNAVIEIVGLGQGRAPSKEAILNQSKCEYVPHVLVVPVGATVVIQNSDGILHNVHTLSKENAPFNRAQPKYLKEIKETFSKVERIPVRCDVHGWMSGWIVVTGNVFYDVTPSDGTFKLGDVPAGKYTLEVWHETLGKATQPVELKAGETVNVTFEFVKKP
jgi:plastocyanin